MAFIDAIAAIATDVLRMDFIAFSLLWERSEPAGTPLIGSV
jgi:hypothetical protein